MKINTFCGHLRPRASVLCQGQLLKNNKPSQLDPLPVIMAVGEGNSQQRIREKQEFSTKMRYRLAERNVTCPYERKAAIIHNLSHGL